MCKEEQNWPEEESMAYFVYLFILVVTHNARGESDEGC